MPTIMLRSRADRDGILHLDIPSEYANAELDVSVTVTPVGIFALQNGASADWPSGFFEKVVGGWQGEPLKREESHTYEIRDEL